MIYRYLIYIYIILLRFVLKVHVSVFNCQGRQGSNMRPRESFFPEFTKVLFVLAKEFANIYLDEVA